MSHIIGIHNAAKLLLFTTASSVLAYLLAHQLRFDFEVGNQVPQVTIWLGLCCLILSRLLAYIFFKAINLAWRYFSLTEFIPLIKAHIVSTILFLAAVTSLHLPEFPRSVAIIEFILSLCFNVAAALSIRVLFERGIYPFKKDKPNQGKDCLVIGAGTSGHLLVKSLLAQKGLSFYPVGVLDDSDSLISSVVHGVPVLGSSSLLEELLTRDANVSAVILAIPSLSATRTKQIEAICKKKGVEFSRIQSFEDLAVQRISSQLENMPIEQVLQREFTTDYEEDLLNTYKNKVIIVTGGAGSIGSEAVKQLASLQPKQIIVIDNSEFYLFNLERELSERHSELECQFILLDVCDKERLKYVFQNIKPDIVLHAAALKHVPMSELNPYSAFKVNVLGTKNVVELCVENSTSKFILLSSDKAVEPANVMGCSKRIAELITQEIIRESKSSTNAGIVRFGNVVNSRGSVIPLFTEQIKAGGPLTVTHPEIERYFMSIQEAVRLMLVSGTIAENGEIYVLDMGKKIKIKSVAEEMLKIAGREDIEIVYTGLRSGEKMTEELKFEDETLILTKNKKIQVIDQSNASSKQYLSQIKEIFENIDKLDDQKLVEEMFSFLH